MSASDVFVKWVPGNGQWAVFGANLGGGGCWSLHDEQHEAEQEARALADDFGVEYKGVQS